MNTLVLAHLVARLPFGVGQVVVLMLACVLAQPVSAKVIKPTVLKVSSWAPPGHLIREGLAAWCDELGKRSRGTLQCDLAPASDADISQMPDVVAGGAVDIAIAVHSLNPEQFVLTRLAELPMHQGSAEQVSVAYYKTWQRHLSKRSEHADARVLTVFTQGAGDLYTALEPVNQLAHIDGLKLAAGGGTAGQVLKQFASFGAELVEVPLSSAVHSINDHVLDGLLTTSGNVLRYGLGTAFAHLWQVPGGLYRHSYALLMNPSAWAALSPAAKKTLAEMSGETAARIFGRAADLLERSHLEFLRHRGLSVSQLSQRETAALQKQLDRISQAWLTDARNRGLANAAEVLKDFRLELKRQRQL